MAISAADALTRRLPKFLTPKAHAAGDYLAAGMFFAASALFWRRNRRAALGSAACGGLKLVSSSLTDYDESRSNLISLPFHKKADLGIAAMSAAIPEFLGIQEPGPKRFFLAQAVLMTVMANLTDFSPATTRRRQFKVRVRERA
ncbi:MAG TPA: hypothetical protein VFA68_02485 [Terriglobales bacterium]|nr:hypothetical protein [Terriglobales bacterium]